MSANQYAVQYRQGYDAGRQYTFARRDDPAEFYRDETGRRRVRGHGTMHPAAVAGWMRGFRHGLMDVR